MRFHPFNGSSVEGFQVVYESCHPFGGSLLGDPMAQVEDERPSPVGRDDALRDLPIIVVTADASPGLEDECLETGADAVLFKPIAMQSLFDSIAALVVDRRDPDAPIA